MRITKHFASTIICSLAIPTAGFAQVRWEATTSSYVVAIPSNGVSGPGFDLKVVPANLVEGTVEAHVSDSSGATVTYRYVANVSSNSPQRLAAVFVPCPEATSPRELSVQIGGQSGTGAIARVVTISGKRVCRFLVPLKSGQHGTARLGSPLLPGVGEVILKGSADLPHWPSEGSSVQSDSIEHLVDSLNGRGIDGLVKRVDASVPMYPRAQLLAASTGLPILATELTGICAETDWIQPGPTCDALVAQIATASGALGSSPVQRANPPQAVKDATRQALTAFIQSVAAGRGTTINENAFSILNLLARTVRSGIGQ